ncbi:MAG: pyridoxal phosphate-dependent aminotransferase [Lachnospiraceae bacterium]|nr:pyridoxal phosphate-dependent aminotransferase [Lachnospiraceae bacterium]
MGSGRFDEVIDRYHTNSEKYDFKTKFGKPEDVLPLWVADMDFRAPEEVLDSLHAAVSHGIFGYSEPGDDYFQALANWFSKKFHWEIDQEWLLKSPGVVFGIHAIVRGLTNEGDAVMIQPPVYYPFFKVVEDNHRKLVCNRLVHTESGYEIDFEDFENKIKNEKVKLFIFCSPHNPVGRVWRREELEKILEICTRYDVLIASDEIHCDFTYPGHEHIVFATLSEEARMRSMVCTAPSKTFNLAGLQTSNLLIPNKELRKKVKKALYVQTGYQELNQLGLVACQAAYEKGEKWLEELKEYLKANLDYIREFLQEKIPQIRLVEPEGTYLVWLDCRGIGLSDGELEDLITNKARLWLSAGSKFDQECGQYERVNIACPRSVLVQAMRQLESAVKGVLS